MKLYIIAKGRVQGVFYRAFVRSVAERFGVVGFVRNLDNGDVEIYAEGEKETLENFIKEINVKKEVGPFVKKLEIYKEGEADFVKPDKEYTSFVIEY
jgi:acylphosphatase